MKKIKDKILEIRWYKSKADVYLARMIWFVVGVYGLYLYATIFDFWRYLYAAVAFGAFGCSWIAGRYSYKENKEAN